MVVAVAWLAVVVVVVAVVVVVVIVGVVVVVVGGTISFWEGVSAAEHRVRFFLLEESQQVRGLSN